MDLQLGGKRALVTGSSSGLGEEIARVLAAEGAAVVVHGRDEARTEAVAKSIRGGGGTASIAIGDLSTDAGADQVQAAAASEGPVDILVNNAGVYDPEAQWSDTVRAPSRHGRRDLSGPHGHAGEQPTVRRGRYRADAGGAGLGFHPVAPPVA